MTRHSRNRYLAGLLVGVALGGAGATAQSQSIPRLAPMEAQVAYGPWRVPGDLGRDRLVMTVRLTNTLDAPVMPDTLTVTAQDGRRLLRLSGPALQAKVESILIAPSDGSIPASGVGVVTLDMAAAPGVTSVTTRVHASPAAGAAVGSVVAQLGVNWTTTTGQVPVLRRRPVEISPPVRGATWANFNACCMPSSHEFNRLNGGDGWRELEMFGIDFMSVANGQLFRGTGARNEDYFAFGRRVVSATGGVVTSTRNDMTDIPPRTDPTGLDGIYEFAGNHVIVRAAPGVYVLYAHFARGSVRVTPGQRVRPGQVLARLGNSGFTSAPHLHFQLVDRGTLMGGESLPYVFTRYTRLGQLAEGESRFEIVGPVTPQRATYPFALGAYRFPVAAPAVTG